MTYDEIMAGLQKLNVALAYVDPRRDCLEAAQDALFKASWQRGVMLAWFVREGCFDVPDSEVPIQCDEPTAVWRARSMVEAFL